MKNSDSPKLRQGATQRMLTEHGCATATPADPDGPDPVEDPGFLVTPIISTVLSSLYQSQPLPKMS